MSKKRNSKYPGLDVNDNLKIRHEVMDQDYVHKLSKEEKLWLNNFNLEDVQADFNHPGKRIYKKKVITRKIVSTGKLRKFDVGKKDAETRNNARNRDAFGICRANNILETLDSVYAKNNERNQVCNPNLTEDALIELIDFVNSRKKK